MSALVDIIDQRFGRWTVKARAPNHGKHAAFLCRCACGNEKVVVGYSLRRGHSTSCGCVGVEHCKRSFTKHGQSGAWKKRAASRTYRTWSAMINRCQNLAKARWYGHVSVCDRWRGFENFLADMGERPEGKTLDRWPDPAGNYEPGNCRWATPKEQANNKR